MFCSQFRPLIGGAERQAEKLAEALVRLGCKVKILTPRIDPNSPTVEHDNGVAIQRFILSDFSKYLRIRGIALVNIPWIVFQVAFRVAKELANFDIIHCHVGSPEVVGAAMSARFFGRPILCKAAVAGDRSDLGELEKTGPAGRIVAHLLRWVVQTWVATTAAVQRELIAAGIKPSKVIGIPNGVPLKATRERNPHPERSSNFLYLGRVSTNSDRDIDTLLTAFDQLATDRPNLQLAIVGGGDLLQATREAASKLLASSRIQMPGFSDSEYWLEWADYFVLPSRREGLSNALLEAMARGLPCIANDIPSNREVLNNGKAGVLVPVGDVVALRNVMCRFVVDAAFARAIAQRGLERIRTCYAIEAVAAQYNELYSNLLRQH